MALPTHVTRAVVLGSTGEAAEGPLTVTAQQGPEGFDCIVTDAAGAGTGAPRGLPHRDTAPAVGR